MATKQSKRVPTQTAKPNTPHTVVNGKHVKDIKVGGANAAETKSSKGQAVFNRMRGKMC